MVQRRQAKQEVTNGTITVELGHKDTFTLHQLPVGTTYQVEEKPENAPKNKEVESIRLMILGLLQEGDWDCNSHHQPSGHIGADNRNLGMGSGWTRWGF